MNSIFLMFVRRVARGTVSLNGMRFYGAGLEALNGAAVEIAVGEDGRVYAGLPGGDIALEQVA